MKYWHKNYNCAYPLRADRWEEFAEKLLFERLIYLLVELCVLISVTRLGANESTRCKLQVYPTASISYQSAYKLQVWKLKICISACQPKKTQI